MMYLRPNTSTNSLELTLFLLLKCPIFLRKNTSNYTLLLLALSEPYILCLLLALTFFMKDQIFLSRPRSLQIVNLRHLFRGFFPIRTLFRSHSLLHLHFPIPPHPGLLLIPSLLITPLSTIVQVLIQSLTKTLLRLLIRPLRAHETFLHAHSPFHRVLLA